MRWCLSWVIPALYACMLITFCSHGQDPPLETLTTRGVHVTEKFSVLRSDTAIRHGVYRRYFNNQQVEKGMFSKGKKEGLWEFYSAEGILVAEGQYANDQRVGVWTFYAKRKRMVQKYDYTTKRVLHYDVAREKLLNKGFELIIPDEFPSTNGNQRPVFIGGVEYLKTVLMTNVDLSKEQWSAFKYTDPLYVSLTISAAGRLSDAKIVAPAQVDAALEHSMLNAIKKLDHWVPELKDSVNVGSTITFPLQYGGIF